MIAAACLSCSALCGRLQGMLFGRAGNTLIKRVVLPCQMVCFASPNNLFGSIEAPVLDVHRLDGKAAYEEIGKNKSHPFHPIR